MFDSSRKYPSYHLPSLHDSNVRPHDLQMGRHTCRIDSSCHDSYTLCGCLTPVKCPITWITFYITIMQILFFYGSRIRQRSLVSKKILAMEEENQTTRLVKS